MAGHHTSGTAGSPGKPRSDPVWQISVQNWANLLGSFPPPRREEVGREFNKHFGIWKSFPALV